MPGSPRAYPGLTGSFVGKGNRVRARGRGRFRKDCEVGEAVFRSIRELLASIDWSSSDDRAVFIPANLAPRQSSNRFRSGIALALVLVLGSLPPYCLSAIVPRVLALWKCPNFMARSAWDSATPRVPSRRVRSDSCRCAHRLDDHRTRTFQQEYLGFKNTAAHFDEKYLWDSLRPIIPCPTGRIFRGTLSQALRARLRSVLSLRDALAIVVAPNPTWRSFSR